MDAEQVAVELEPTPVTSLALLPPRQAAGLELWEPDALRAMITREIALREVMLEYMRSQMKRGKHYYTRSDLGRPDGDEPQGGADDKPSLTKEGALNVSHLLHCRPASPEVFEAFHADGHYTVRTRVKIISLRTGEVVGEGEGLCTTLESKYAWRWLPEWKMPEEDREGRVTRKVKIKKGQNKGKWLTLYRIANVNIADLYNTILKLSYKRGLVAGVLTLPLASELFTQDVEDMENPEDEDLDVGDEGLEEGERQSAQRPAPRQTATNPKPAGTNGSTGEPIWTKDQVDKMTSTAVNNALAKRLRYLGPDNKEDRHAYIRLAFGDAAGTWGELEPLGLSVRKTGLLKLVGIKKDGPPDDHPPAGRRGGSEGGEGEDGVPADDDDVPLGEGAEAHLGSLREERQETKTTPSVPGSEPQARPFPKPAMGADGFVTSKSLTALQTWAKDQQVAGLLDESLRMCQGYPDAPMVTEAQYGRFATRCQEAALAADDDVP